MVALLLVACGGALNQLPPTDAEAKKAFARAANPNFELDTTSKPFEGLSRENQGGDMAGHVTRKALCIWILCNIPL